MDIKTSYEKMAIPRRNTIKGHVRLRTSTNIEQEKTLY